MCGSARGRPRRRNPADRPGCCSASSGRGVRAGPGEPRAGGEGGRTPRAPGLWRGAPQPGAGERAVRPGRSHLPGKRGLQRKSSVTAGLGAAALFLCLALSVQRRGHSLSCSWHLGAPARRGAGVGWGDRAKFLKQLPASAGASGQACLPVTGRGVLAAACPLCFPPPPHPGSCKPPVLLHPGSHALAWRRAGPLAHSAGSLFPGTTLLFPALSRSFPQSGRTTAKTTLVLLVALFTFIIIIWVGAPLRLS